MERDPRKFEHHGDIHNVADCTTVARYMELEETAGV
jgi:hypothetical protein